ncbi:MAG: hypothetical protein KDC66_03345, partial [Phaeodactylibacter sp.]|nr:hypothetical protein [Phaeodactylibacter sp.]
EKGLGMKNPTKFFRSILGRMLNSYLIDIMTHSRKWLKQIDEMALEADKFFLCQIKFLKMRRRLSGVFCM